MWEVCQPYFVTIQPIQVLNKCILLIISRACLNKRPHSQPDPQCAFHITAVCRLISSSAKFVSVITDPTQTKQHSSNLSYMITERHYFRSNVSLMKILHSIYLGKCAVTGRAGLVLLNM